jgi:hypothetical protein
MRHVQYGSNTLKHATVGAVGVVVMSRRSASW